MSASRRGDHFRSRILSVGTTARALGVPLYAYLRRVCAEALESQGVRTLLPIDALRRPPCRQPDRPTSASPRREHVRHEGTPGS